MDFYDALNDHLAWKNRLRSYIDGTLGEFLAPEEVGCEDGCELGRWIRSQNLVMKEVPEFEKVRELHANFHRCVAEVVRSVNAGNKEAAEQALQKECVHISNVLVKAITKLSRLSEDKTAAA